MKIISKEKDFYDYMLAYGVDETEVFVREPLDTYKAVEKGDSETTVEALMNLNRFRYDMFSDKLNKAGDVEYSYGMTVVYFCGAIYPAMILRYKNVPPKGSNYYMLGEERKYDFFYSVDDFLEKCGDLGIEKTEEAVGLRKHDVQERLIKRFKKAQKELNTNEALRVFNQWSHKLKAAYYQIHVTDYSKDRPMDEKYKFSVTVHPILRELRFDKCKDGMQVFQEVEQYLFGELKMGERETVEISDKDMATAKGHGDKYSFKKMPTKKKGK